MMAKQPTEAQKEAGNYAKDHRRVAGMRVSVENKAGTDRTGVDKDGTAWKQTLTHDYGYIRGTKGRDKDHIDTFLGPLVDKKDIPVYVIDQGNEDGTFDEHKVMMGFNSEQDATDAYHANYEPGWRGFQDIKPLSMTDFKNWAFTDGARKKPIALCKGGSVKGYADGGMVTSEGGAAFGNPNLTRQGRRDGATTQQPSDYQDVHNPVTAAIAGLLGTAPDELAGSVMDGSRERNRQAAELPFALSTAAQGLPIAGPVVRGAQTAVKGAGRAVQGALSTLGDSMAAARPAYVPIGQERLGTGLPRYLNESQIKILQDRVFNGEFTPGKPAFAAGGLVPLRGMTTPGGGRAYANFVSEQPTNYGSGYMFRPAAQPELSGSGNGASGFSGGAPGNVQGALSSLGSMASMGLSATGHPGLGAAVNVATSPNPGRAALSAGVNMASHALGLGPFGALSMAALSDNPAQSVGSVLGGVVGGLPGSIAGAFIGDKIGNAVANSAAVNRSTMSPEQQAAARAHTPFGGDFGDLGLNAGEDASSAGAVNGADSQSDNSPGMGSFNGGGGGGGYGGVGGGQGHGSSSDGGSGGDNGQGGRGGVKRGGRIRRSLNQGLKSWT